MTTTFIERCVGEGDFDIESPGFDGGQIDPEQLHAALCLYNKGTLSAAAFKTLFSCSGAQGEEVDEIFATRPSILSILDRSQWDSWVYSVLKAGSNNWAGFETAGDCRNALGL